MNIRLLVAVVIVSGCLPVFSQEVAAESGEAVDTVFSAVIKPVLDQHCVKCHGPEVVKSELRMDSAEGLKAGSKNGPIIVPGDLEKSKMIFRITLPEDDIDIMPPEKEPRMDARKIELLKWWISKGAPFDLPLAEAELPEKVKAFMRLEDF